MRDDRLEARIGALHDRDQAALGGAEEVHRQARDVMRSADDVWASMVVGAAQRSATSAHAEAASEWTLAGVDGCYEIHKPA